MSASGEFLTLMGRPEEEIPLDVGCLLIAAHAHPPGEQAAVVDRGRGALDALAAGCARADLGAVVEHLFGTVGFAGNRAHYDDPRNSFLDEVIGRRTGIPITLSVVLIEVARRVGLPLAPVGMPGHFLVGAGDGRFVDAFDGGRVLDEGGCRRRFAELAGPRAPWRADLLAPVGPRAVLARVLANLRRVYGEAGDLRALDWVLALRVGIPGVAPAERAERATVLSALGRYDEAAAELDRLAAAGGGAELRQQAARLRARLN